MSLRERIGVIGELLFWGVVVLALIVGITAFGMWQYGWSLPWQMQVERNAVKQSQSFTNSSNLALSQMITQYNGLEVSVQQAKSVNDLNSISAYQAQERSLLSQMCMQVSTMNSDTVSPSVKSFLASKGGCQ